MSDLPNGIPALIEKKLQEERKLIAEYVRRHRLQPNSLDYLMLTGMALSIESGEYRKGEGK